MHEFLGWSCTHIGVIDLHRSRCEWNARVPWSSCLLAPCPITEEHHATMVFAPCPSLDACTCSIMFPFSVSGLKIVPNMWHLVPLVENTQPLEDSKFLIAPHNHQTKSNVVSSIYCYPPSVCRTIESCVVQNPGHDTYHHLCKSDTPSI